MTGTEKQIAWAQDIVNSIKATMDIMIADNKKNGNDTSKAEAVTEKLMANFNAEYAGNIIDDFKDCRFKKFVDPETEVANHHYISDEVKAELREHDLAIYEEENVKAATANYRTLNAVLAYALKHGRNYMA